MKCKRSRGKILLLCLAFFACVLLFEQKVMAEANDNLLEMDNFSGVTISPDKTAWTTDYMDKTNERLQEGYTIFTGISSRLQPLKTGEHYYTAPANGYVPVGQWKVGWSNAQCIHKYEEQVINGFHVNAGICEEYYNNGWLAYCADCGEEIAYMFMYGKSSTMSGITQIPAQSMYVYICPHCGGLEQGAYYVHQCKEVSYNHYKIIYDKNRPDNADVKGYMAETKHMYHNAAIYEGIPASERGYDDIRLRKNSFSCAGYIFKGWNTKPDGSGQCFEDGQTILNLCDEEGETLILYAQWEQAYNTLFIDANGGTYCGDSVCQISQPSQTAYQLKPELIKPAEGYRVCFEEEGGSPVEDIYTEKDFVYWEALEPMQGSLKGDVYTFSLGKENVDWVKAQYLDCTFILPNSEKNREVLVGWYKDEACSEEAFAGKPGDEISVSEDVILYAKWTSLLLSSVENYEAYGGVGAVDLSWSMRDGQGKFYKIYQSLDKEVWEPVFTSDLREEVTQIKGQYHIEEQGQQFEIPYTGYYFLEAYGGKGGDFGKSGIGGNGGYVSAQFWLQKGDLLTFYAGEKGEEEKGGTNGNRADGGTAAAGCGSGGGAATEIYLTRGSLREPLLIAGGGSGAGQNVPGLAGGESLTEIGNRTGMTGEQNGGGGGAAGGQSENSYFQTTLAHPGTENIAFKSEWSQVFPKETQMYVSWTRPQNYSAYPMQGTGAFERANYFDSPHITVGELAKKVTFSGTNYTDEEYHFGAQINEIPQNNKPLSYYGYQSIGGFVRRFTAEYPVNGNTNAVVGGMIDTWGAWTSGSIRFKIYDADTGELRHDKTYVNGVARRKNSSSTASWDVGVWSDFNIEGMENVRIEVDIYGNSEEAHFTAKVLDTYFYGNVITIEGGALGGTSYINPRFGCKALFYEGGVNPADGYAGIESKDIGYFQENELKAVLAKDLAAPGNITDYCVFEAEEGTMEVSWKMPKDYGTDYYHRAEAFESTAKNMEHVTDSNITINRLTSGVKGYHYYVDDTAVGKVSEAHEYTFLSTLVLGDALGGKYLHVAAVDTAGNIGETTHIKLVANKREEDFEPENIQVMTRQLQIKDTEFVHGVSEKLYYVKADGITEHALVEGSYVNGTINQNFQINHVKVSFLQEGQEEWFDTNVPMGDIFLNEETFSNDLLQMEVSEQGDCFMKPGIAEAVRRNHGMDLEVLQHFTILKEAPHYTLYPRAEIQAYNMVYASEEQLDVQNALTIIPDGEPPVIKGLEKLQELDVLNMEEEQFVLELSAYDELSGLEEFHVYVKNCDNHSRKEFDCNSQGKIVLEIDKNNPVFIGEIEISALAVDKVGNASIVGKDGLTFTLDTCLYRERNPEETIFKTGDGAVLEIMTKGYVERIEVHFPKEMSLKNEESIVTYEYTYPYLRKQEKLQFNIPLGIEEKEYEIIVKAYKKGEVLIEKPVVTVVKGSVLDELRTRIRNNG